jgi:exopolysaccharide biosynthesis polyprenyl glycosylphosphotransferase
MTPSAVVHQIDEYPSSGMTDQVQGGALFRVQADHWSDVAKAGVDFVLASSGVFAVALANAKGEGKSMLYANVALALLFSVMTLLACGNQGLYDGSRKLRYRDQVRAILISAPTVAVLLSGLAYLCSVRPNLMLVLRESGLITTALLLFVRAGKRVTTCRQLKTGTAGVNVLLAGINAATLRLARFMDENPDLGYRVIGFVSDSSTANSRVLGSFEDLSKVARAHFVDEIIVSAQHAYKVLPTIEKLSGLRATLKLIPDVASAIALPSAWEHIDGYPVMTVQRQRVARAPRLIKRLVDIVGSSAGLLLLAPAMGMIAIAIKLDSKGPVLFKSTRVARKARHFTFLKFRTMIVNAEELRGRLLHLNKRDGPFFKIDNDPRITRIGHFLRKYSLDEIPQLWHVLAGDMSLVGPRPHPLVDYSQYELEHLCRLDVPPGLTGLWQVTARKDPSWQKNISLDKQYIENWSLWLDCKIILKTIPAVLFGGGE